MPAPNARRVPRCLTIAASDSGGGAGIQADLRAFAAAGCFGSSAVTAVTAQNTLGVQQIHVVPADVVAAQIRSVLDDIGTDAIKTGVLATAATVRAVSTALAETLAPLVIDPVLNASAGGTLAEPGVADAIVEHLLPRATVVTPNLDEAAILAGGAGTRRDMAERIAARGARAVLITGGHGDPIDHLFHDGVHTEIPVERHAVAATHGSGCTHSATLAAELAKGADLETAARVAARVTADAVAHGLTDIGSREGPVDVLSLRARPGDSR